MSDAPAPAPAPVVAAAAAVAAAPAPAGTIHDLGYKRYAGARHARSTRWQVIARHQIAIAWKTWWRYKSALALAVIVTCISGGIMFLLSDQEVRGVFQLGKAGNIATTLIDGALPRSIQWYSRVAFLLSLTIGARVVAGDVQSGAFTFYFARTVRPRDYVIGKLIGLFAVVATIMLAGPLLLAMARLALADSADELIRLLPIIPKTLLLGVLGTLAFAAVPLGFSALIRNPRYALASWAVYYLVVGGMMYVLSRALQNGIGALDIATAIDSVTFDLFDMKLTWGRSKRVDAWAAYTSLLVHAGAAIALVAYKVRRAHLDGIGGSS
jgi:ABC-2 type transport system permease protein